MRRGCLRTINQGQFLKGSDIGTDYFKDEALTEQRGQAILPG